MKILWGPGEPRHRTSQSTWSAPRRWHEDHASFYAEHGRRRRVFCSSLSDVFDNAVPSPWREDLLALVSETSNLNWLLLTKRIGNVRNMVPEGWFESNPHVWLGATIVNRAEMLRDASKLLEVAASVRFWGAEPLLEDLGSIPRDLLPDWVIAGGESGPHARFMEPAWAKSIDDQCQSADVPFWFKQNGGSGRDKGGILLCGQLRQELPADLA